MGFTKFTSLTVISNWFGADDPEISKSLMTVDIPVIGIADCLEDYEWTPTDSEFCAGVGYEGRGGCKVNESVLSLIENE